MEKREATTRSLGYLLLHAWMLDSAMQLLYGDDYVPAASRTTLK
jgi:hypothetical protein